MDTFAKNLKRIRIDRQLTIEEAAKIVRVGKTTWNQWENGQRKPNLEMFVNICNAFHVSASYLLEV